MPPARISIPGALGFSADRSVFLGFAAARLLCSVSFADVLDEDRGTGYQRRLNQQHSVDFRRFIQRPGSSTIPLTFNARPHDRGGWKVVKASGGSARLEILPEAGRVLTQVDCQHRLGYLSDLDTPLPFMCYLGLTSVEEMETFSIINSKAKGLSTSLLDYHAASLATNLAEERPELLIALHLNTDPGSPWHRQLDLGGVSTSGLKRRASLRTMQKAVKHFLARTRVLKVSSVEQVTEVVLAFWSAVACVLNMEWSNPRQHLLAKGIGVYALMEIAGDLVQEAGHVANCDRRFFVAKVTEFLPAVDWSGEGTLCGLGGEAGVKQAVARIRQIRTNCRIRAVRSA